MFFRGEIAKAALAMAAFDPQVNMLEAFVLAVRTLFRGEVPSGADRPSLRIGVGADQSINPR